MIFKMNVMSEDLAHAVMKII